MFCCNLHVLLNDFAWANLMIINTFKVFKGKSNWNCGSSAHPWLPADSFLPYICYLSSLFQHVFNMFFTCVRQIQCSAVLRLARFYLSPSFVSVWDHIYANTHFQKSHSWLPDSMWIPLCRTGSLGFLFFPPLEIVMGVRFSVGNND